MKNLDRKIIWSNMNLDFEDWREYLQEEYPESSDDDLYYRMYEHNDYYLDDERINLNIQLSRPIIIIADLGLWNGRFSGYKEIKSGNIRDCLYADGDYVEWFVDESGDLRADVAHHDGTNHYLYRVYKDNVSERTIENLKNKIYNNTATFNDIARVTRRLGPEIARVYGW